MRYPRALTGRSGGHLIGRWFAAGPVNPTDLTDPTDQADSAGRATGDNGMIWTGETGAGSATGGWLATLPKVLEYLLYALLLALPLDVYLSRPGRQSGVFLSQVLTLEAGLVLMVTLLLMRWKRAPLPLRLTWRDALPLSTVLVASAASAIFSDFRGVAAKNVLKVGIYLGIYLLARALHGVPGIRMRAMLVLLAGFGVVVISGLLGSLLGVPDLVGALLNIQRTVTVLPLGTVARVSATFRDPSELAAYLVVLLMLLLASAATARQRLLQFCYALLALAGLWVLVLTSTWGALIAALVVAPALVLVLGKRKLALIVLFAELAGLGVLALGGGDLGHRILSAVSAADPGYSTGAAAGHWALTVFEHHPIFGAGIGTIQYQPGAPYTNPVLHIRAVNAENLVLNILAEMGIVGIAAVVAAVVGAISRAWGYIQRGGDQFDRAWNAGVLAALAALLLYGVVDPVLVSGQVTGLICALVGLLGVSTISTIARTTPPAVPAAPAADAAPVLATDTGAATDNPRRSIPALPTGTPASLPQDGEPSALRSRVVFLLNSSDMGGAQIVSTELASELQRAGADVLVVCPPGANSMIERLETDQVPYRAYDMGVSVGRWRGWLGTLLFCLRLGHKQLNRLVMDMADETPSIFVAPFLREQLVLARLSLVRRIPVVWVLHSPLHYLPHRLILRREQRRLSRVASAIIAITRTQAAEWMQSGMPASRMHIIPNGIPDSFFATFTPRNHPVYGSSYRIGFISRLSKRKGAQFLIKSLPHILQRHPNTTVVIAGSGKYERRLRRFVATLNLHDHVQFPGFVTDVPQLLQTLDLVVLPTIDKGEVLPTILLEASAAGVPVIATDLPGIREAVVPGKTGILISSPENPTELADAVSDVLSDPDAALSMGAQGREYIHTRYALSRAGMRYLLVLDELAFQDVESGSELLSSTSQLVRVKYRARFMGQTVLYLVSKVLSAARTAVWTILAAGTLTQTAYGNLMLGVGMLDIFAGLNDAGITTLATREAAQTSEAELPSLSGNVILIKLALGILSSLVAIGAAFLAPFSEESRFLLLLIAPSLIFSSMLSLSLLFRARAMLRQIVAVTALVSIASTAVTIFVALGRSNPTSFALILLGTATANGFLMLILVAVQFKPRLWPDFRKIAQMIIAAIPYGVSLALIYLYYRIDVPLLAILGGAKEVAVYTSAYRILDVITLLPAAASGIALAEMAKLAKEPDRKYLVQFSQQYLELAVALGLLIALFLSLSGREILRLLFQGRYNDSYPALFVLGWAAAATLVTNVFLPLVNALDRRRVLIFATAVALVANVSINLALIPRLGSVGAAIATLCTEIVVIACYAYVVVRELHWRLRWRVILAAVVASGVGFGAQQIGISLGMSGWLVAAESLTLWLVVMAVLAPQWLRQLVRTRGNLRLLSSRQTTPTAERERELALMDAERIS